MSNSCEYHISLKPQTQDMLPDCGYYKKKAKLRKWPQTRKTEEKKEQNKEENINLF